MLLHKKHSNAHSIVVVQATIGAARMAVLQHQPEGQDGGHGPGQPTDGTLPSEPSGRDQQPIECNICEKRFKTKSALNAVSFQVPSRELCPSH